MMLKSVFLVTCTFLITVTCFAGGGMVNPDFTISKTTLLLKERVTFTDNSNKGTCAGIRAWQWDFGPGATPATSDLQNPPPVSYSTPGTKSIRLTVSGTNCGSRFILQSLTVENIPIPTMSQWSLFILGLLMTCFAVGRIWIAVHNPA